ncbi:glycosyltransferase [Almyronema epifaneia]|uniref:Glycosyltransferase n=1 Tax=Almyronema epifaneia S1 TaxID=2991925 RepID=A0ABW6IDG6_9CYAN
MKILMIAKLGPESAYLRLFKKNLALHNVEIDFFNYYQRKQIFPIFLQVFWSTSKYDVVHFHWTHPYILANSFAVTLLYSCQFLVDAFLLRLSGAKIVWTIHNHLSHDGRFKNLDRLVSQLLARMANKIVLLNQTTADMLSQSYSFPLTKAVIIPHGNYKNYYGSAIQQADARKTLDLPLQGKIYLSLGLIKAYKGLENLINVWTSCSALNPDDYLLIVGKVASENYAKVIQEKVSQTPNIILKAGFVKDDKIHLFYSAADIAIFPFKEVLNSGSLILAMTYSKPVIAPNFESIAEVLDHATHLLYNPEDPEGLVNALIKSKEVDLNQLTLLTDEACDKLDWENISQLTLDLYQTV